MIEQHTKNKMLSMINGTKRNKRIAFRRLLKRIVEHLYLDFGVKQTMLSEHQAFRAHLTDSIEKFLRTDVPHKEVSHLIEVVRKYLEIDHYLARIKPK